jgi:hypothetical protein
MDDELWCHVPTSWVVDLPSTLWYKHGCILCLWGLTPIKMYTRASASDYDDFQAKGWTTKELIPLMKKYAFPRLCLFQPFTDHV